MREGEKEIDHWINCEAAFMAAWRQGVSYLSGKGFFHNEHMFAEARIRNTIRPNLSTFAEISNEASSGEVKFAYMMASFYNQRVISMFAEEHGVDISFTGISGLGLQFRNVIKDLLINYNGWSLAEEDYRYVRSLF